ncbi:MULTISPECIES: DUF1367 family protein [Yersinia pseudotuberculosis complex]|uniref:DUF1367 family protein n=1 Tax=Yersinia pseudotuberculosis serotype O:1b (strain IP 31758) TaxID=349747 RepID=A0A0U1QWR0_YERP3|nr:MULTISPECIES: DUF1367 family protein [Yersinia pseudotuberculosis complex]ABS47036.1 conserved hypothetical protein [Yersinia pseudotuberculosis IP 31758]AJK17651.1 hypothetical protein BZ19_1185 [Yersinia pseudotuberculosis str. PA3606]MCE4113757.1 DUF1367 family protein [Yersinia pseudotuberculosis]MCF1165053.1 DUF1367 family protein [Yersinia pseudotuberculosis]RYC28130.1 DUF1367 family protein [Yersinia pseudotuberculosis]
MAQYSFTKSAGGILVPATPDAESFVKNTRLGTIVTGEFKRVRNAPFHRKFFSLLNLGFEYWEPSGGAISPFELQFLRGYINRLMAYVGNKGVLHEIADDYLALVAGKRAANLSTVKSFHAFRRWVTVEAGHYDLFELPDGSTLREPRSISFSAMDELEFNDLYKSTLNVLWTFILSKSFNNPFEVENAASQLMSYAA